MRKPLTHKRQFWCETCEKKDGRSAEPMNPPQFLEHLKTVHGIEGKVTGRKEGLSFIDGAGGEYHNSYRWHLPGDVKVQEVASGTRE